MEFITDFEKWFEDLMRQRAVCRPKEIYALARKGGRQKCEVQAVRKQFGDKISAEKDSDGFVVWRWIG